MPDAEVSVSLHGCRTSDASLGHEGLSLPGAENGPTAQGKNPSSMVDGPSLPGAESGTIAQGEHPSPVDVSSFSRLLIFEIEPHRFSFLNLLGNESAWQRQRMVTSGAAADESFVRHTASRT